MSQPQQSEATRRNAFWRRRFETTTFNSDRWLQKAFDLFESAKLFDASISAVWESSRARHRGEIVPPAQDHYQGAHFMLLSFAVENILKAAIVQRNRRQFLLDFDDVLAAGKNSRKGFPEALKSHDLYELATTADLSLKEGEEDLLRRLTRCAEWAGRYPSPLRYEDMSNAEQYADGETYSLSCFRGNDVERLKSFIRALPSRLGLSTRSWNEANP